VTVTFRGGRLPNDPAKPRLKLGHFLTATAYSPPPAANWDGKVSAFDVLGNDAVGDCALAAQSHALQTWTANAGTEVTPTTEDTLRAYSEVTGYDPADPSTDQGTVMQDALAYWRRTGMPIGGTRHKILAFAEVDHRNPVELDAAIALFGEVLLGLSFPASAMDAFNQNEPWDVWEDDGGIEGGHAVCSARYDTYTGTWRVITWGREQEATAAFFSKYLDEAWCAISPEWIAANGTTPSGLDLASLGEEFTRLTGDPAPWAGNIPPEPPGRHGSLDVAVQALIRSQDVAAWLRAKHSGTPRKVAALVRAIVDAAAA
jgi:hypothetical protein